MFNEVRRVVIARRLSRGALKRSGSATRESRRGNPDPTAATTHKNLKSLPIAIGTKF